MIKYRIF